MLLLGKKVAAFLPRHSCVWFISLGAEFFVPECHLFCFVFHLGLCFHAFPININALIVYFTEKLDLWEFSDQLLLLLLGAVLVSVMSGFFRDCTIWAPANGDVTQCFLKGNTQAAKKKKYLLVMLLELLQRVITVRVQLFCSWGKGLVIPFGKDFFSEPRALGGSFIWVVVYSNVSLDLRY